MSNYTAKWGNDFNLGTSIERSFLSIQPALEQSISQGFVTAFVYDGLYNEILVTSYVKNNIEGIGKVILESNADNQTCITSASRGVNLKNIEILGYATSISSRSNGADRESSLNRCRILGMGTTDMDISNFRTDSVAIERKNEVIINESLIAGHSTIELDIGYFQFSSFSCDLLIINRGLIGNYLRNCIVIAQEIRIQYGVFKISNCIFSDNATFTYDDGNGNSVNQVNLSAFQVADELHGWGFGLENCFSENVNDIFIDNLVNNFHLKPDSLAFTKGLIGAYGTPYEAISSNDWSIESGFVFDIDKFTTNVDGELISSELELGRNIVIDSIIGEWLEDLLGGLLFGLSGNLSDNTVISGSTQTGLSISLTEGTVYYVDGYSGVTTDQRTLSSVENFCFTADTGEVLTDVNGSGSIRIVVDLSGERKIQIKFWQLNQIKPSEWHDVFLYKPLKVDSEGRTNAEIGYDDSTGLKPEIAYIQYRVKAQTLNIPS